MKLNNRSDFVARVVIHDANGEPVAPSLPFTMTFGTDNNAITYVARSDDAQLVRLNDDGKSYTVVFDFNASRPYLQNGRMWVRCAYIDDNDIFPDGKMNITVPQRLPYEIWDGRSDTDTEISVLIASAYVNVSPIIPDGTITKPKLSPELQAAIDGLVRGAVFMGVAYPQDEVDTTGLTKSFWLAYVDGVYPSYGGMSVPSDSDIAVMAFIYDGLGNWMSVPVLAGQFVHGLHNIQPRTIEGSALRYEAISSSEIKFDAINQYHIQPNAVTNEKIGSGAVTREKIAADAVGGSQMSPYAVTSRELADGAVIGSKIPARTITQEHIVAGNIGYGLLRLRVAFPRVSSEVSVTLPTDVTYLKNADYSRVTFGSADLGEMDVVVWLGGDDDLPQVYLGWLDASLNGKCTLGHMSAISNEELSSSGNPTRRLTYTSGNGMQVAYLLDTTMGRFEPTKSVMESLYADIESGRIALPRSRFVKSNKEQKYRLMPAGAFKIPAELGLPYIGVQSYMHGTWRLTTCVTGVNGNNPFQEAIRLYVNGSTRYSPDKWVLERANAYGEGYTNISALFQVEFMPIQSIIDISDGDITYIEDDAEYITTSLPARYDPLKLRIFTRDRRNINGMPPSAHNKCYVTLKYTGTLPNVDPQEFHVDLVRKGNKQVVRRRYRVGYVWAKAFLTAGCPNWDMGYLASNWTTLQVTRVVYLNRDKHSEPPISVDVLN